MATPNLFLIYVTDTTASTAFYSDLFEMEPEMVTPRYVSFEVAPGVLFSLWSGASKSVTATPVRTSEVGLMVPGSAEAVTPSSPIGRPRVSTWSPNPTTKSSAALSSSPTRMGISSASHPWTESRLGGGVPRSPARA